MHKKYVGMCGSLFRTLLQINIEKQIEKMLIMHCTCSLVHGGCGCDDDKTITDKPSIISSKL